MKSEEVLSSHSKLKRNTSQPAALRPPSPPISTAKSTGTSSLPLPVFHSESGSAVDSSPDVNSWSLVADWDESEISASPLLNTFDVSPSIHNCSIPYAASQLTLLSDRFARPDLLLLSFSLHLQYPTILQIGRLACLDSGDCDRLCVTVRVAVVGGKTLELGRGYIYLSDIADDNQSDVQDPGMLIERMREKSVNIYTKGSDYLVAILQLSAVFHSIEQPDTID